MGLKNNDLRDLVYKVFEIDSYKSKMGNDKDIVVLSFSVKYEDAARDLMNFIEKGYPFVLDADTTPGEQSDGTYKVFVEIERDENVPQQILEIVDGVQKLTGMDEIRFRYYKGFESNPVTEKDLKQRIPLDPLDYDATVTESNMNNFKNFFNRSYVDSIQMLDENITIKKIYADPLKFRVLDFGLKDKVFEAITESLNFNDFGEVIFLSKYIGDYNITKFGNKITLENQGHTLVLERI